MVCGDRFVLMPITAVAAPGDTLGAPSPGVFSAAKGLCVLFNSETGEEKGFIALSLSAVMGEPRPDSEKL